jgi:hypothetical protein
LVTPGLAGADQTPPGYAVARIAFEGLDESRRVELQIMLTAAGFWPAVPNKNFNLRIFDAIAGFQAVNGFPATGYMTAEQADRLAGVAEPLFARWGLAAVPHPTRGHLIWVPMGLGLRTERTAAGLAFIDPAGRLRLDYDYYAGVPLVEARERWLKRLASIGDQVIFERTRENFFAIVARNAGGTGRYVRFQQDGYGIIGFAFSYDTNDPDLHGDRLEVLISGSLWSMTPDAPYMPLPSVRPPAEPPYAAPAGPPQPPPGLVYNAPVPTPAPPTPAPPAQDAPTAPVQPAPVQPPQPTGPPSAELAAPATPPAPAKPAPEPEETSGTGFFVSWQGGILTNAHVVKDCARVRVAIPSGVVDGRVVAKDTANDLALIESDVVPTGIAGFRSGVRLGEAVAAFGYPLAGVLATSGNFTLGNVTALTGLSDDTRYIQISAPVQPGNSGGPLVDANGNVVGVVTSQVNALKVMLANGNIPQNVNFAIKGSVAATFLESNRVAMDTGMRATEMAPADLADYARDLSVHVTCR